MGGFGPVHLDVRNAKKRCYGPKEDAISNVSGVSERSVDVEHGEMLGLARHKRLPVTTGASPEVPQGTNKFVQLLG